MTTSEGHLPASDDDRQSVKRMRQEMASRMRSPGAKFILIGFISLFLLIPLTLVWSVIEERGNRAEAVAGRIANGWGGDQTINGPYLAVPFDVPKSREISGRTVVENDVEWALVMPETLDVSADLKTEQRQLSIYTLPVYNGAVNLKGRFAADTIQNLSRFSGVPQLDKAILVLSISDITGIRSDAGVKINGGAVLPFDPGMREVRSIPPVQRDVKAQFKPRGGVHRNLERSMVESGFTFDIALSLNGSRSFSIAPAGQTTSFAAKANWPHPGFEGLFLPDQKTITDTDFDAKWTIPYLARGIDKAIFSANLPLNDSLMTVNLVEPLKFYQVISRTLKYSIGFISVVFLAVFVMELTGRRAVHWIQYVLTGLALIVFYILLLALAEHTGFNIAYACASFATTLLIAAYLGSATANWKNGVSLGAVLSTAYGVMYLLMNEDEYALLAGALISFVAIAATMYATRRVEWSPTASNPSVENQ